ncbi:MAG: aspartate/glutamate racemase family protein [Verrucomicrobia bacterium]|nr:aspartate/glutamate racemase family protein [Verrucomicrobiota bacterium]
MKTIGLIGGMSWESTATYYQIINELVRERLGGLHSAQICLCSLDFAEIADQQRRGDWVAMADTLGNAAAHLEAAGADCVLVCTNTMHKVADAVQARIGIPLLHIIDAAAGQAKVQGLTTLGLLGTRFTMEDGFYADRLRDPHGLDVIIPDDADRAIVHSVIYDELCQGKRTAESRAEFARIMNTLADRGAQGIVLGCTEIGLLVDQSDVAVPILDTTPLHARAAVDFAFQ